MLALTFLLSSFLAGTLAKQCTNITVPVTLSARNGVFNLPTLQSNLDATTFIQNFTRIGGNFTDEALLGYATVAEKYNISAKYCQPDVAPSSPVVQFLTHGIGFDKTYWDISYNNFNYSYIDTAVDKYGFSTLSIDRFGIGNSSIADPLDVVQAPAELSAILEVTTMLRQGTLPGLSYAPAFDKVVHVGHSFGSVLTFELASMHPNATDGLILTGFSGNATYLPTTFASFDTKLARLNQPIKFGNISYAAVTAALSMIKNGTIDKDLSGLDISLAEFQSVFQSTDLADFLAGVGPTGPHEQDLPNGYLTWVDAGSNQYDFLLPGYFDPGILVFSESTKQPYTMGEVLTIGSSPESAPEFTGPVLVITGDHDAIFCGGDCYATGIPELPSIPADVKLAFPVAKTFEAYLQPNTGHAINAHYNATGAYEVIQEFLIGQGLGPS